MDKTSNQVSIAETAHELRLPIANIKLLVETLLDGALDDRDMSKKLLKRAYQEVERLQALVTDILGLEQAISAREEIKFEWLNLRKKAIYAIDSTKKQAEEKNTQIFLEIAEKNQVYANSAQLDQVFLNLLENAIKFTPKGGKIWLRSGETEGTFIIEDTGIGIEAQEIPKIFSRFYRIDKSGTHKGTGLGLSIVKQVLDLHGAKISINSEPGKGSLFQLEFPCPKI